LDCLDRNIQGDSVASGQVEEAQGYVFFDENHSGDHLKHLFGRAE
jgi:hypothetical protein